MFIAKNAQPQLENSYTGANSDRSYARTNPSSPRTHQKLTFEFMDASLSVTLTTNLESTFEKTVDIASYMQ